MKNIKNCIYMYQLLRVVHITHSRGHDEYLYSKGVDKGWSYTNHGRVHGQARLFRLAAIRFIDKWNVPVCSSMTTTLWSTMTTTVWLMLKVTLARTVSALSSSNTRSTVSDSVGSGVWSFIVSIVIHPRVSVEFNTTFAPPSDKLPSCKL